MVSKHHSMNEQGVCCKQAPSFLVDKKGNPHGLTEFARIPEIPIIHHWNYTSPKNIINKAHHLKHLKKASDTDISLLFSNHFFIYPLPYTMHKQVIGGYNMWHTDHLMWVGSDKLWGWWPHGTIQHRSLCWKISELSRYIRNAYLGSETPWSHSEWLSEWFRIHHKIKTDPWLVK